MNVQHSSRTDRWHTPDYVLDLARAVLGDIDLDPCSETAANERVSARYFLTEEDDGLSKAWGEHWVDSDSYIYSPVSAFVNPPGGKRNGKSNARLWWRKLMDEVAKGDVTHAIWLSFSLEHLQTTQGDTPSILDFPICVPRKRIRFLRPDGTPGPAPSHSNVIAYVPGTVDRTDLFLETFQELGKVKA